MRKLLIVGIWILLIGACAPPSLFLTPTFTPAFTPTPTATWTPTVAPTPTSTPTSALTTYVVQPGDTLARIAARYETTAEAICVFNALSNCSLIRPGQELVIPPEGFTVTVPTASPTPAYTPTWTVTSAPSLTPTPQPLTPTPTDTPTATATSTPTPTSTLPPLEFLYEQGSIQTAPNCGTVYMQGIVLDRGGGAMNGVTVRLQFFDITVYRVSGVGQAAGAWGFTPLGMDMYHTPVTFHIQLVNGQSDPSPRSDVVTVNFTDCSAAGQFTNIVFRRQW